MFVQSHIQRHHNHHGHNHRHNHGQQQLQTHPQLQLLTHSQSQQQQQWHGHRKQHQNSWTPSVSHKRFETCPTSNATACQAINSTNRSSTAAESAFSIAGPSIERVLESSYQHSSGHEQVLVTQINRASASARDAFSIGSNFDQQHRDFNQLAAYEVENKTKASFGWFQKTHQRPLLRPSERANAGPDHVNSSPSLKSDSRSSIQQLSPEQKKHNHRHSYRERTRSLGSHESLKVYDFMPRNTKVASVQAASSGTTSYCEPPGTLKQQTLRLAQPVELDKTAEKLYSCGYSCRVGQEKSYKFSDCVRLSNSSTEKGRRLQRFLIAGGQQLLDIIWAALWILAGKLTSLLSLSRINQGPQIELVRAFWKSFISYQLETWVLIVSDLTGERQVMSAQIVAAGFNRSIRAQFDQRGLPVFKNRINETRSATLAGDEAHDGRHWGRNFRSLDRPILERQREVVFDFDDAVEEPIIRIPAIVREAPAWPPARQSIVTSARNHHSQHQHRHEHRHNHDRRAYQSQLVESRQVALFDLGAVEEHNHTNHHLQRHNLHSGTSVTNEFIEYESHQTKFVGDPTQTERKLYKGQHSLDCDYTRRAYFNAALQPNQAATSIRSGNDCVGQIHEKDEIWSDRPFSDEDFRPTLIEQQVHKWEHKTGDESANGNCDQYDMQNLITERLEEAARKKKALKKSSSPLSFEGARRRLGLRQRKDRNQLSTISVNRSEEVIPTEVRHLSRQTTFNSLYDSGTESGSSFWRGQLQFPPDPRANFVEGIGSGQIASRQALVSPYLGDIQLSLSSRRGMLEVEVIRARGLQVKRGVKSLPSPYVKVYLMKEKKCIAKCRTHQVKQTLDPLYQEPFVFRTEFKSCVLQVIVWGDYGKRDRKSMMGIVQIRLDDLDISNIVIGWYKLFNITSMTNSLASSKTLRQKVLQHSSSISESPINN